MPDQVCVADVIETRWRRYGKDRVYVKSADGVEIGHVDLVANTVVPQQPGHEELLRACLERWAAAMLDDDRAEPIATRPTIGVEHPPVSIEAVSADLAAQSSTAEVAARDLAANVAGAAARAKRDEINAQAPVRNLVARVLGVTTEERAWRVGAKGEEKVGGELAKLGDGWHVLHAVEVGHHGSDIDHVVIGPAGVFSLNTKRHPAGKVWVGERMVMVNGHRTDYLRNSRFESARAARLLSGACGRPVPVAAVIVTVDLDALAIKQMPNDVHVTTRRELLRWLRSRPPVLDPGAVADVYRVARLDVTWR
jgi:hypothetical protein